MPLHNPLWEIAEPYLVRAGLYTVQDPTYGRYTLPPHPPHLALLNDESISQRRRRVHLKPYSDFSSEAAAYDSSEIVAAEDVEFTPEELRPGRWVVYTCFELKEPPPGGWVGHGRGHGTDVVLVHGLSDYGLRYAPHVKYLLDAGFRVIIPDLPSFGRSTGVNSYLPSALLLPAALQAVLTDLVRDDLSKGKAQRKVFLSGASMGGWTILYYLLKYPPGPTSKVVDSRETRLPDSGIGYSDAERPTDLESARPRVAGAFVMCPAVEVSPESRPWLITELIGRGLKYAAGTLPLAKALRGKVSDDPRVEEDFFADRLCYHGWLRVATGLALLEGMTELQRRAEEIDCPIRLVHGSSDRVVAYAGTIKLHERLRVEDKEVHIYPGYEHVMLKVGVDEADDAKRQAVLEDWREWLLKRC